MKKERDRLPEEVSSSKKRKQKPETTLPERRITLKMKRSPVDQGKSVNVLETD